MVFGTGMTNQAVNAGELAHGTTHPHLVHLIAKRGNAHKAIHGLKYTCRLEFGPSMAATNERLPGVGQS